MKWILVLACVFFAGVSSAQKDSEADIAVQLNACLSADSSTSVMGQLACVSQARKEWGQVMSQAYDSLYLSLDAEKRLVLEESQAAWEESINADYTVTDYLYSELSGTMYKISAAMDQLDAIEQRVHFLRYLRQIPEEFE